MHTYLYFLKRVRDKMATLGRTKIATLGRRVFSLERILPSNSISVKISFGVRNHQRLHSMSAISLPSHCRVLRGTPLFGNTPSSQTRFLTPSTKPRSLDVEKVIRVKKAPEKAPTMIQRFLGPKKMPERHTAAWYKEVLLICTVFAITGSSTMVFVRPAVRDVLGIEGTMKDGPWSYRICSIVVMSPVYSTLLVVVGTIFGRHAYFRHFAVKMLSRFGIPPERLDRNFYETAKTFKKW